MTLSMIVENITNADPAVSPQLTLQIVRPKNK